MGEISHIVASHSREAALGTYSWQIQGCDPGRADEAAAADIHIVDAPHTRGRVPYSTFQSNERARTFVEFGNVISCRGRYE